MLSNCGIGEDSSRVPWTAIRSNLSILKEISPEYSLEALMLKLQYFGQLMWRADSLEKTLMLGNIEARRRSGWQRMRWLGAIIDTMDMSFSKLWGIVTDMEAWHAAVHWVTKSWTDRLNNSFFNCVQKFVLYFCISSAALKIGSSLASLMRFPVDIN